VHPCQHSWNGLYCINVQYQDQNQPTPRYFEPGWHRHRWRYDALGTATILLLGRVLIEPAAACETQRWIDPERATPQPSATRRHDPGLDAASCWRMFIGEFWWRSGDGLFAVHNCEATPITLIRYWPHHWLRSAPHLGSLHSSYPPPSAPTQSTYDAATRAKRGSYQ